MAKKERIDGSIQARGILEDVRNGVFSPVYLLMGDEPYFTDLVCDAIVENALAPHEREFNQTIFYGPDIADTSVVVSEASLYPMMADRRLVVLKEAQLCKDKDMDSLAFYCEAPADTTVLVILLRGATADKRKALYKNAQKNGVVLQSDKLPEYEFERWITGYYRSLGLDIQPDAAALLLEHAGTDMGKIAIETEKMMKNLPEGTAVITAKNIEDNVGISREFSAFELAKALAFRNGAAATRIAAHIGNNPKFFITPVIAALNMYFYKILKLHAALLKNPQMDDFSKAKAIGLYGTSGPIFREYMTCARNYPLGSIINVMSVIEEYDFKGKGGGGVASGEELLLELTTKILSC